MSKLKIVPAFALALAVGACGTNTADRAGSGAAIGAGTGAVIGAVASGIAIWPAALVGGVLGAGAGALTTPEQVNFGDPPWRKSSGTMQRSEQTPSSETAETRSEAQPAAPTQLAPSGGTPMADPADPQRRQEMMRSEEK